jgi:hypothetical protein
MPSLADAVAQIRAADLPVAFIDTCIIVDPIRTPLRPGEFRGCIEAAQELLQRATTLPARCTLVIASFVHSEWEAHARPVAEKLRDHLAQVDAETGRLHQFCALVGISPSFPQSEYRPLPLPDRLHDLSRQLRDAAIRLDQDQDCIIRAHGRASTYTPPSRKGGEVKDSTIIEECLEVSRRLQAFGFGRKRVFCTSNTKDYCESGKLHRALAVDLGAVGLGFASNLPWVLQEISKTA